MHFKWEVIWTHGTQPNAFEIWGSRVNRHSLIKNIERSFIRRPRFSTSDKSSDFFILLKEETVNNEDKQIGVFQLKENRKFIEIQNRKFEK